MSFVTIAEEVWGTPLPDWVRVLASACDRSSQSAVAAQLGRSPAVISQVLRGKYIADTARIEERVRGVFLDGRVECHALGQVPTHKCQDWREKARTWASGGPERARMFRACRKCPLYQKEAAE